MHACIQVIVMKQERERENFTNRIVSRIDAVSCWCALAGLKVPIDVGLASCWLHVTLAAITGAGPPPRAEQSVDSTTPGVIALAGWAVELWLTLCMRACVHVCVCMHL